MSDDSLAPSLQQLVLATLCFDQQHGTQIALQIRPEHFDNIYRDFVRQVLLYRKKHKLPPGPNQVQDLADRVSYGKENSPVQRFVPELIAEANNVNGAYAASRVQDLIRSQTIKTALIQASDRYKQDDESRLEEVEKILASVSHYRKHTFNAGTFLTDRDSLRFLEKKHSEFVPLGIPALDKRKIGLQPKKLLLYIAPKGTGKSWFCVHCGKQSLLQRLKCVHISLEMDTDEVLSRYFQTLFSVAEGPERFNQTTLIFDELVKEKLIDTKTRLVKPKLDFANPKIRQILRRKMKDSGSRWGGLVVKDYPTSSLTVDELSNYLDYLEESENFVPNVLIVDYPKLMKIDARDIRVSLGRTVEELRGLAGKRNLALVCPHQGNRSSLGARRVRSNMAGEDVSVVQTADTVFAFSRTDAEERLGLGRLSVEHVRNRRGGLTLVLSQAYGIGQYVLSSADMQQAYWEKLKKLDRDSGDEEGLGE
jgi:replicative DNA helicase